LAARLLWEQEVRGSNPRIPTRRPGAAAADGLRAQTCGRPRATPQRLPPRQPRGKPLHAPRTHRGPRPL